MKPLSKYTLLVLGVLFVSSVAFRVAIYISELRSQSEQHVQELEPMLQRYFEVSMTVDGWTKPDVMAQVATGKHLQDMIQFRCDSCPFIQVVTKVQIVNVEILSYSSDESAVRFRIEYGWHKVHPKTGIVIGPCFAQAFTHLFVMAKENGTWKVTDIRKLNVTEINRVDSTTELQAKYCSF